MFTSGVQPLEDYLALKSLIESAAKNYNLDPILVEAIATHESGLNPFATRFEPGWKYFTEIDKWAKYCRITPETEKVHQATSWGLLQLMGTGAREFGFLNTLTQLTLPQLGLNLACKKLAALHQKYDQQKLIISAWNCGTPVINRDGTFNNQPYVDKILTNIEVLTK